MLSESNVNGETAKQIAARLRTEGRWHRFLARRVQLENAGLGRESSWIAAAREFPPEGTPPIVFDQVPDNDIQTCPEEEVGVARNAKTLLTLKKGSAEQATLRIPDEILEFYRSNQKFTPRQDVQWVHLNLALKEPNWETAPSSGALSLLQWARLEKNYFYQLFKNFLPTQSETNKSQRLEDDGRDIEELIDRVIVGATDAQ